MAVSIKISASGLLIADNARKKLGLIKHSTVLAEDAKTSIATLKRFWVRRSINKEAFVSICNRLGVDWQSVMELETESVKLNRDFAEKLRCEGVAAWNKWKKCTPLLTHSLNNADLKNTNLKGVDLSGVSLIRADLEGCNLENANLSDANLSRTNLSYTNLKGANLVAAQFLESTLNYADLTGACIQDWNINSHTELLNIKCDYIYLSYSDSSMYTERRPCNGNFQLSNYESLYKALCEQSLDTAYEIIKVSKLNQFHIADKPHIVKDVNKFEKIIISKYPVDMPGQRGTGQEALRIIDHLLEQNQQNTLKDVQSAIVLQVWEGKSYQSIGGELGYDVDYIKQIATNLWHTLSNILKVKVAKNNLQSILQRYQASLTRTNWGEAIDVSYFYGRQNTLQTLQKWLISDHCRMVGIFGLGGVGKTALSVKLAQQLESQFEYVVWRSLRTAPTPGNLLNEILPILTGSEVSESSIDLLMQQLRQKHCLLVFDNVESILRSGDQNGSYLPGYEDYLEIFERISDENHQSCLVITSREKPNGIALREGNNLPVRSLQLTGLPSLDAQAILIDKGINAPFVDQENLIKYVDGNPLALKLVATNIQHLFNGDIREFLAQDKAVFSNLWDLLDQQFERLSTLQKQVMYWLAINREGVTPRQLQAELFPSAALPQILESLETLRARSLIETTQQGLTQKPVIMEYVTNRFILQLEREVISGELDLFKTHAIIEAQTQGYMLDAQIQLILQPLVNILLAHFYTREKLEEYLVQILITLRHQIPTKIGYAEGNLRHLFSHLKTDLKGLDFSELD
jgi:Pentapeptide repeats (8 copies)/NB-ARC domain